MNSASDLALAYLLFEWTIRLVMVVVIPLRRPPEAARSWLLLVLFLPVPALILYRMIGRAGFPAWRRERFERTASERESVSTGLDSCGQDLFPLLRLARHLGGFPACDGNAVALLTDYDATIDAMVVAIDEAETRVHLLTYIFADDRTGTKVAQALGRAKARSVDVRVLVDALGSRPWAKRSMALLAGLGIDARLVLPVRFAVLRRARSDLRNHRKLCLIDGQIGFVGSQNIVDRDFKPGIVNDELVARVEGPVVAALDAVFASDW
ncbi:phospholipase D-like domain-containing protein [Sphingobium estronivorans]|uniref:phospholipase D-like domain-containing protein n=1 Tax=Sphingobium estronivorans TaxID=1577690 RepID=UPI0030840CE0